ncbi:MAG TPA: YCF48-related protein, partial [Ignavibacteriaceae bacterium]|nr:YCF48-related protein [Ignavibacteriaceae bacterium]
KSFLLFFLLITCSGWLYSQQGNDWKWLHPSPQGNRLVFVQAFSETNWYAVGWAGTFMKTTDGGASWTLRHDVGRPFGTSGQTSNALDAHFFDSSNAIVIGSNGGIFRTFDAGESWAEVSGNPLPSNSTTALNQVHFVDNNLGFIAGSAGALLKTTDGGSNWSIVNTGVTTTFYDVWSPDGNLILVSTTSGNIRRSTDAGATWATVNVGVTAAQNKIGSDGTNILTAGASSSARLSTDNGATWTAASTGLPASTTFTDVDYSGGAFYLTGNSFYLYKSTNLGVSWDTVGFLQSNQRWTSTYYSTIFSPNGESFITVGAFGLINSKIAPSTTPTVHTVLAKAGAWNDIWSSDPGGTVIAVGAPTSAGSAFDQIGRSTDGGNTWAIIPFSTTSTSTLWSISMVNSNLGFASGTNSAIYKTTNGGLNWDSLATTGLPTGATFRKIDFVSANMGWVFASAPNTLTNFIFKTTDGGTTWVAQSHGISAASNGQVYNSHMLNENDGFIVTWEPRPFRTTDGGTTWTSQSTVDAFGGFLYDIKMADTSLGYMVGSAGRFYKTTNGGLLWDTLTVPTRSYSFNSMELIDANTIAGFGGTGVFFLSTDAGLTWVSKNTSAATLNGSHFSKNSQTNQYAFFTAGTNAAILKNTITPIPVELASLSASVDGNSVSLIWKTTTELNNKGFEIERKSSNSNWETLSFIQGKGTTASTSEYRYVDNKLSDGKYTYRLKQIDYDGSFTYTSSIEVEVGTPVTFALSQNYPNPFNPSTTIKYSIAEASKVTLNVYNLIGEKVATLVNTQQDAGYHQLNFNAGTLSSGVYFFTINAESINSSKKYNETKKMM